MTTARVVLRGSESYTMNKKTWLKDVPQIVKGEEAIKQFEANGYFLVKRINSPQPADLRKSDGADLQKKGFVKRNLPNKPEGDEKGGLDE
jgi:hypothetical protein